MSIPLPIPSSFSLQYYFQPYSVKEKIYSYNFIIKSSDSIMLVKQKIAKQASEFYKTYISPYELILAQIDK